MPDARAVAGWFRESRVRYLILPDYSPRERLFLTLADVADVGWTLSSRIDDATGRFIKWAREKAG